MARKPSAYDIPFASAAGMSVAEKRQAIDWWQRGELYPPLACPVCGTALVLAPRDAAVECPTPWCTYASDEIPWAVFAAWQRQPKPPL